MLADIESGKYNYPDKPSKPAPKCPVCNRAHGKDDNYCPECGAKLGYKKRLEAWKKEVDEWYEACRNIDDKFKNDLFKYLGISNNPKRERFYEIVYSLSHSEGLREILLCAEELVELIK